MNRAEKEAVLHCLKSMIDEEACEECPLYGTTGTDHCEKDCVRLAINALEQEPKTEKVIKMRDVTPEERELIEKYIKSISKPTGVDFGELEQEPKTGRWIPVSEGLPEKPDNYPYCGIHRTYFLVSLASGCVKTLGYEFDRDEWQVTGSLVIAWMPLPEPYKAEIE